MIQTSIEHRMCDVCRLLDFDTTLKQCSYCGMCDAWICQGCRPQWGRRLKAAVKRKLEPGFRGDPNYADKLDEKGMVK